MNETLETFGNLIDAVFECLMCFAHFSKNVVGSFFAEHNVNGQEGNQKTHYGVLQRTTTYHGVLRRTTAHYGVLRRTTAYYDVSLFRAVVVSLWALYAKVGRTKRGKGTPLEGFMLRRAGLVKGAGY